MSEKQSDQTQAEPKAGSKAGKAVPSDKRVVTALRQMIMDGTLGAGEKISEVVVSNMFDVSRTPARLALRALEVEGLLRKRDGRGYTVMALDLGDISKAYEVRGVLEGLAAGTLARVGMKPDVECGLLHAVQDMDKALASDCPIPDRAAAYQEGNIRFHELIMQHCDNQFIGFAFARMESLPLVALGTLVFNSDRKEEELMRLKFGNMQHRLILDALTRRDPQRAETLMREHANQIPVYSRLFV